MLLQRAATDRGPLVVASDFNQARRKDYDEAEWAVVAKGLASVGQPEDDGVADLFVQNGWRCDSTESLANGLLKSLL